MLAPKPLNRFLYPRTIIILRANTEVDADGGAAIGLPSQPGSAGTVFGVSPTVVSSGAGETQVMAGVKCSIQARRVRPSGDLPSSAAGQSSWFVLIPRDAVPKGTILDRDTLIDDEQARYQVVVPYWNSMGWRIEAIRLENS